MAARYSIVRYSVPRSLNLTRQAPPGTADPGAGSNGSGHLRMCPKPGLAPFQGRVGHHWHIPRACRDRGASRLPVADPGRRYPRNPLSHCLRRCSEPRERASLRVARRRRRANKAEGCASGVLQAATMSFQLVWWHGGRKTVLWTSRNFTGSRTCSPTKTISHARNPTVYLVITLHCHSFPLPCQGSGSWSIKTNH